MRILTLISIYKMARTRQQIYDELVAAKNSAASLDGLTAAGSLNYESTIAELNSGSRVETFRLWLFVSAFAIWSFENILDAFKKEVDETIRSGIAGSLPWIGYKAKAYQHGDSLTYGTDFIPRYAVINPANQIVKYAAPSESVGVVVLRVAKQVSNAPVPLSNGELAGFTSYMNNVKPGGLQLLIRSVNADSVYLSIDLFASPLYDSSVLVTDARTAVGNYLASLQFGEALQVNAIEDALQKVAGVNNVRLQVVRATAGSEITVVYNLSQGVNAVSYNSFAGYFELNVGSIFNVVS